MTASAETSGGHALLGLRSFSSIELLPAIPFLFMSD